MINRRVLPKVAPPEIDKKSEELMGRAALVRRLRTTTPAEVIRDVSIQNDADIKRLNEFRAEYIYPQLRKRYGVGAVNGAMLLFKNPRNIEQCINAVLHQQRINPMCDEWDEQGIRYTTAIMEI